jgi:hypothetical protein
MTRRMRPITKDPMRPPPESQAFRNASCAIECPTASSLNSFTSPPTSLPPRPGSATRRWNRAERDQLYRRRARRVAAAAAINRPRPTSTSSAAQTPGLPVTTTSQHQSSTASKALRHPLTSFFVAWTALSGIFPKYTVHARSPHSRVSFAQQKTPCVVTIKTHEGLIKLLATKSMHVLECDYRMNYLIDVEEAILAGIDGLIARNKNQPWFDGLFIAEYAEVLFGALLTACQAYCVGTITDMNELRSDRRATQLTKLGAYAQFSNSKACFTMIELINSGANCFKHRDE